MTKCRWEFEPTGRRGGATGEAFANTLQATGMSAAAVLAREAIQNSVDAHESDEKVRIQFRRVSLVGAEKKAFVKSLALKPGLTERRKALHLPSGTCLDTFNDDDTPLRLLYIEDYNTHGLYGAPESPKSHFFRLLFALGDGSKAREADGTGGSFGFGKSVYSSNSRIRTLVAYSVFDPKRKGSTDKAHARLMGCSYFDGHEIGAKYFSGRAWYGAPSGDGSGDVDPLSDAAAHEVAESLGFQVRGPKDYGTSMLVVDCGVECEELRESIEDWWWPRILDDGLDVALYEQGKLLSPPKPKKRADLKPFINCYEMAVGRSKPTGKHEKSDEFNKFEGIPLGSYGFTVVDGESKADNSATLRTDAVALIRGSRMVVSYLPVRGGSPLQCAGAFVAAPEVDKPLKVSEPPEHNRWDVESSRLDTLGGNAREIVRAVLTRLKQRMRDFANEASPAVPKQEIRLRSLERLLGHMFRPPTTSAGGGGGHPADPIEIHFVNQPHPVADEGKLTTRGSFGVALAGNSDRTSVKVALHVECLVQEDEGVSRDDPVAVQIESGDVDYTPDAKVPGKVYFPLGLDQKPNFSFRTGRYEPDWTTRIEVNVEEV